MSFDEPRSTVPPVLCDTDEAAKPGDPSIPQNAQHQVWPRHQTLKDQSTNMNMWTGEETAAEQTPNRPLGSSAWTLDTRKLGTKQEPPSPSRAWAGLGGAVAGSALLSCGHLGPVARELTSETGCSQGREERCPGNWHRFLIRSQQW